MDLIKSFYFSPVLTRKFVFCLPGTKDCRFLLKTTNPNHAYGPLCLLDERFGTQRGAQDNSTLIGLGRAVYSRLYTKAFFASIYIVAGYFTDLAVLGVLDL